MESKSMDPPPVDSNESGATHPAGQGSGRYPSLDKALELSLRILEEGKKMVSTTDEEIRKAKTSGSLRTTKGEVPESAPDILLGDTADALGGTMPTKTNVSSSTKGTKNADSPPAKQVCFNGLQESAPKPSSPPTKDGGKSRYANDRLSVTFCEDSSDGFANALQNPETTFDLSERSARSDRSGGRAALGSRSISVYMVKGDDGKEQEVVTLEEDIFSLMIVAENPSRSLVYSIFVFCSQITTLGLILYDILQDPTFGVDKMPFNLPINVGWQVTIAQFIALVIAVISLDDLRTTLSMVYVGYDPSISDQFPGASRFKFIVASTCRFIEGILVCFVAFVFVMQSDNILDIFMNFAAVEFISNLDNLSFALMNEGYLGRKCQQQAQAVLEVEFPVQRPGLKWVSQLLLFTTLAILLSGWAVVFARQSNGLLLKKATCQGFEISFGDSYLILDPGQIASFEGSFRAARNNIYQRFNTSDPPFFVPYTYFSGMYYPLDGPDAGLTRFNSRPVYTQGGVDDPTAGRIYYCENRVAWVFTVPALVGALPEPGVEECGSWGWLMKSPLTEVYTLESAPEEDWLGWVGDDVALIDFSRRCIECLIDTDCNFIHGVCNGDTKTCDCIQGQTGYDCSVAPYASSLRLINYGETAFDYEEYLSYDLVLDSSGSPFEIHNRPVYRRDFNGSSYVVFSTGQRWYVTLWGDPDERDFVLDENFHAYWDGVNIETAWGRGNILRASSATTGYSPKSSTATWFTLSQQASLGESDDYSQAFVPVQEKFVAEEIICGRRTCGTRGICSNGACECKGLSGGYFCEIARDDPYAVGLYDAMMAGVDVSNYTYYQRYWKDSDYFENQHTEF